MGLHIAVVGLDGVNDGLRLLVLSGDIHADGDVAALYLVVNGLAQVVQQTGPLGHVHIHAQLGGQQPRDVGHFDGVVQHVLAVAGAVSHAAQQLDDLRVQAMDIGLEHGPLTLGLDDGVDLFLGLGYHFLNAGGVDAAVLNQLLQSQTGHLAADRVKAGDGDGFGGIVNDQVAAGEGFDAADIAAFAADDAALHLVVGEGYDGDGDLAGVISGAALNGGGDDLPGAGICFFLVLGLDLLDLQGHLVGHIVPDVGDQVGLGFLNGEAGDFLQHFQLALLDQSDLLLLRLYCGDLVAEGVVLLLNGIQLPVQVFFLLLQAALLLLQLGAALLYFPLVLRAAFVYFFLCLYESLSLLALCAFYRLIDDALGLFLGAGDLPLSHLLTVVDTKQKTYNCGNRNNNDP